MNRIKYLPLIAVIFLPFCANPKGEPVPMCIGKNEVSLAVQLDVLRFACERRLSRIEANTRTHKQKPPTGQNLNAVRASDPVHE